MLQTKYVFYFLATGAAGNLHANLFKLQICLRGNGSFPDDCKCKLQGMRIDAAEGADFEVNYVHLVKSVLMPLMVCPNCPYYRMEGSVCISGMNVVSRRIASEGDLKDFPKRGEGLLCHNNLYMAGLLIPVIAIIPALILNFSGLLLLIFLVVVGLLLFRVFVIFPKIACIYCCAKNRCPNAQSMGLKDG